MCYNKKEKLSLIFMPKTIKLKFKLNQSKDLSSFFGFLFERQYDNGRNFNWAVLKYHPFFKNILKENNSKISKKQVSEYIKDYYKQHDEEIKSNVENFSKSWKIIEDDFLELTAKLFPGQSWPNGKYIAYLTIWRMYPRFLDDKTFQIPYSSKKKTAINLIIAHELLHFIFYAYFLKKYPKYRSHKYDFFVWHVSEIFNSVILKRPEWKKLLKYNNLDYPEHREIISKFDNDNFDIADLISRIMIEVKESLVNID